MQLCRFAVLSCFLSLTLAPQLRGQSGANAPDGATTDDLAKAHVAAAARHWPQAEQLLNSYLMQHELSAEGHNLLGLALLNEDRPKDSLQEFTRGAHLQQPSPQDLRYVALDYVLLHDYVDADHWMSKSVEQNNSDSEAWYDLGRICYQENRFTESAEAFRKSLVLDPRSVKAENNLGLALEGLDKPDDALVAYRQAIAWQQDDPHPSEQPLLNLGILLSDRNDGTGALAALTQAEAIAPRLPTIHAALGKLYKREQKLDKAQAELELAVAAKPDDASLHFQLGDVYRREGRQAEAKAQFAQVSALDQTHSDVH